MRRFLLFGLAALCLVAAALSLPLPLPAGTIFMVAAIALLLLASPGLKLRFDRLRQRYPAFNRRMTAVESYLPPFLRRAFAQRRGEG
ncbi:MAG: hypothetical protein VX871_10730 [Pseudomonadota bacterium]|nr:hypothetical protein [Pseudomonadota bacterium]